MKCVKLGNTPNMEEDKVRKNHYKSIMNESGRQAVGNKLFGRMALWSSPAITEEHY